MAIFGNLLHPRVTHAPELAKVPARRDSPTLPSSRHTTAMIKRAGKVTLMIGCKAVWRHQQYAVMPTALGAATLQAFWNNVQWRS